jgi:hypothetical protein
MQFYVKRQLKLHLQANTPKLKQLVCTSAKHVMQSYLRAIPSSTLAADGHPFINQQQEMPLNSLKIVHWRHAFAPRFDAQHVALT